MTATESKLPDAYIEMSKRFAWFRNEYISKRQIEASKLINCSQGKLSEIEAGKRKIDFKMLRDIVLKFNLNTDWLATGEGSPLLKVEPEAASTDINKQLKSFEKDIRQLQASLQHMEKAMSIMEMNTNMFLNRMQRHSDEQQEKINSLLKVIEDQQKKLS